MKPITGLIINIFVIAFGIFCIYWGIRYMGSNSAEWPAVPGKISSSQVDYNSSDDGNEYYIYVAYEYTVDNVKYEGSFKTGSWSMESDAKNEQINYRTGKEVTVYYDPKDPATSTNSPGEMEMLGLGGLAAGIFCVGGGGWAIVKKFVLRKA